MPDVWRTQSIWSWRSASPKNQDFHGLWFCQPVFRILVFFYLPDPHPDPLVTSMDRILPFSNKSVTRTEIMVAKKILIQKFSCSKFSCSKFSCSKFNFCIIKRIFYNSKVYSFIKHWTLCHHQKMVCETGANIHDSSEGTSRVWEDFFKPETEWPTD
jgi:hypothetical protein